LPTSFDDLLTHLAGIPYSAWRKASDRIQQNTFALDNLYFFIGPKTNLNEQDSYYKSAINSVTKLFAKVPQSKHVYLIYYGKDDIDWAQMQFEKYMDANYGYGNKSTAASNNCNPPHCEGGMAVHTANFDSIILMGDNDGWAFSNFNPNAGYKGHTFAHEYTHTIQLTNMNPNWGGFPSWLAEGIAEWSATVSVFAGDYEGFMNFRNHADLGSQFGSPATYNYAYFEKFLNPSMTFEAGENINTFYSKYPHWDSYAIGMMVAEILVSIKDPESLIEVFNKINSGLAFPDAFQAEYGISWSEAAPKIARAISAQIEKGAK
jgi:hypothetical protein